MFFFFFCFLPERHRLFFFSPCAHASSCGRPRLAWASSAALSRFPRGDSTSFFFPSSQLTRELRRQRAQRRFPDPFPLARSAIPVTFKPFPDRAATSSSGIARGRRPHPPDDEKSHFFSPAISVAAHAFSPRRFDALFPVGEISRLTPRLTRIPSKQG